MLLEQMTTLIAPRTADKSPAPYLPADGRTDAVPLSPAPCAVPAVTVTS